MSWPKQKRQTDNQQYTKENNISAIVYNMNKQKTKIKMKKYFFNDNLETNKNNSKRLLIQVIHNLYSQLERAHRTILVLLTYWFIEDILVKCTIYT